MLKERLTEDLPGAPGLPAAPGLMAMPWGRSKWEEILKIEKRHLTNHMKIKKLQYQFDHTTKENKQRNKIKRQQPQNNLPKGLQYRDMVLPYDKGLSFCNGSYGSRSQWEVAWFACTMPVSPPVPVGSVGWRHWILKIIRLPIVCHLSAINYLSSFFKVGGKEPSQDFHCWLCAWNPNVASAASFDVA